MPHESLPLLQPDSTIFHKTLRAAAWFCTSPAQQCVPDFPVRNKHLLQLQTLLTSLMDIIIVLLGTSGLAWNRWKQGDMHLQAKVGRCWGEQSLCCVTAPRRSLLHLHAFILLCFPWFNFCLPRNLPILKFFSINCSCDSFVCVED